MAPHHQILTRCAGSRYSFSPGCDGNASYQASRLRTVCARKRPGAWPSPTICARSAASRVFSRQDCANARKKRWSPVSAVDHRRRLAAQRFQVGLVRDVEAGDVGDVLAQRLLAVEVQARQRFVGVVLRDQASARPP